MLRALLYVSTNDRSIGTRREGEEEGEGEGKGEGARLKEGTYRTGVQGF